MDDLKSQPGTVPPSVIGQEGDTQIGADGIATAPAHTVTPDVVDAGNTCEVCTRTGLAIMPFLQTVVPANVPGASLGAFERDRGCAVDVGSAGYKYALRTVREGYLYLFFEKGARGRGYYELYSVDAQGRLWYQLQPYAERATVCCQRVGDDAGRMEFLVIEDPTLCGKVWIAFSQHKWTPEVMDRYADDVGLRAERMQSIEPAKWITSPQANGHVAPANSPQALQAALEYRTFNEVVGEIPELPHLAPSRTISQADGSHDEAVLRSNSTRYPWWLRNQQLSDEPEPDIALSTSWQMLRGHSHDGGPGKTRTYYPPMLVAVWDAIGIVHELNGYRHDVVGCMARYKEERALEFNAMEHIDEISTLLRNNAAVLADRYAEASRARLKEIEEANKDTSNPVARAGMETMRQNGLDSGENTTWDALSKAMLPSYQRQAQEQWQEKYWPLIDEAKYNTFKQHAQTFSETALELLKSRSGVLGEWLKNELFLVTLEDYDGTSPVCGVRFEEAVTDAIEGLGMDEKGRGVLTQLAGDLDVTSRSCLLWRVVAQNQDDAREELTQALREADTWKDAILGTLGTGWTAFSTGSGYLKRFLVYYKKFESAQKEAAPSTATNRILRESGVDRFVTTAGAFMLNRFPLQGIQDTVGNAIVRFVFCTRALMNPAEASDLITREASTGVQVRAYFLERIRHYRAQGLTQGNPTMYALRDVERHHGRALMQQRWQAASDSSRNAVRLNSLTGVLELVYFINLLSKADKQARDYGNLVASGASLASLYTSVAESVSKDFFGEASRSAGRMKAIGGWLGGFGTYIGVYYDVGDIKRYLSQDRQGMVMLTGLKSVSGALIGGAQFLTALAYSAPLLQKVVGRTGMVIFLDGLRVGIQSAAVREGEQVLASQTMKRIGLWVVRLGGWEITLVVTAIQGVVWMISPNALETWCERNHFGKASEGGWLGFGASKPYYKTLKEQDEEFFSAMGEVTARPS